METKRDLPWTSGGPPSREFHDLPVFPDSRALRLEDRRLLQPIFEEIQPEISDRCFTNLFMWQRFYDIQVSRMEGAVVLFCSSGSTPEKQFFFPPLGRYPVRETLQACFDFMERTGARPIIRRAPEDFVRRHARELEAFHVEQDPDISDYVYRAEDLINLRGRRYNGQRNFISRFKKRFEYVVEEMGPSNVEECMEFCSAWCSQRLEAFERRGMPEAATVFLKAETRATQRMLRHFSELGLTGMLVRIQGAVAGITVGELLNRETAVIHVEKCDHSYLGISQFISQEFSKRYWSRCRFINRMEDLGIETLKKAKIALGPHHMALKYNIVPKP